MKLNTKLYDRLLDSAIAGTRVYVDELARIDENYEEQLRLIETVGVKTKKYRETKTGRVFVEVQESPVQEKVGEERMGKKTGAEPSPPGDGKDQTLTEESLPKTGSPAPVSSMSPASSPPNVSPKEKDEELVDLKTTFVFKATEITTTQGKRGSTIKLVPKTDADGLVAARFSQVIKKADFIVFLKPSGGESKEEIRKEAAELSEDEKSRPASIEEVQRALDAEELETRVPADELGGEDIELPAPITPKTVEERNVELEEQALTGKIDRESARAQSDLMTGGIAGHDPDTDSARRPV